MHCTHVFWPIRMSHSGFVGSLQSVLVTQTTHSPRPVSHSGAVVEQSEFCRHATHSLFCVLHNGVGALQLALVVQPLRHVKSRGSQIGAAAPQSAFARHSTHVWSPRKQRGAAAPQSLFARQSTQWLVTVSHNGCAVPVQSELVLQPTHAPVAVSQIVRSCVLRQSVFEAQATWH